MNAPRMNWELVSLADAPPQPWKNGGGSTRELLAWPSAADWRVRLSVAEVAADGPFSRFEGVQRWFAVLTGAGVQLAVNGATHTVTVASPPLAFDGAADTHCILIDGPTQDFNLMLRGGTARVQRVQGPLVIHNGESTMTAIYTGDSGASIRSGLDGEAVQDLPPHTLAWCLAQ